MPATVKSIVRVGVETNLLESVFVALFMATHLLNAPESWVRPLSEFRGTAYPWIGFALLFVLVLIGAVTTWAARQAGKRRQALVYGLATALLLAVTLTPSYWLVHHILAAVVLGILFLNVFVLLRLQKRRWLSLVFLGFPGYLWAGAMRLDLPGIYQYGVWQKIMIMVFLAVIATHRLHLTRLRKGR